MKLYLDTETRSATRISDGLPNYFADPYFKVLIVTWAVDDSPVRAWQPVVGEPMPTRLQHALDDEDVTVLMHNAAFDLRALAADAGIDRVIDTSRVVDTAIQALAHGLPAGLAQLSQLFGSEKIEEGKALIQQFCTPLRSSSNPPRFNAPADFPGDWETFVAYAKQDVEAMRHAHKRMPTINYPDLEHHIWRIDREINERGIPVDMELAEAAVQAAAREREVLNAATHEATNGEVDAATQRDALIAYIAQEHDVWLPDLQAATLESYLSKPDLPEPVRALIELRQKASLNTAAKYRRVLQHQHEGRLQNTMQIYGASRTGRDAGRVFQPQNLRRPTRWKDMEGIELENAIEIDVESIKNGSAEVLDSNVMDLLGNCIRGVIAAPKGKKFVVADLSNIEGRGLVWLSGEEWKLEFFRKFDAGEIQFDNYVAAYAKAMNVKPSTVNKYQRAIGKVMELGLGYGGGVAAFLTFAAVYHLDLAELADAVWGTADVVDIGQAEDKYEWAKENGYHADLPKRQYAAFEYLKQQWRKAHPKTETMWGMLETAFRRCTATADQVEAVGEHLRMVRRGPWLYIRLPSGRCLTYLQPKITNDECTYVGRDSFTKRVQRIKTYSGKLAENVTSGTARDVMFHRLPDVEEAGYKVVLRVHDELVCEVPDSDEFTSEALSEIMCRPYDWSEGLPLAADGFETKRYRK